MNSSKQLYSLKHDSTRIKMIQEASLDSSSRSGFIIENGLLFGTPEWFNALEIGGIKRHIIEGTILDVSLSGHCDFPEFTLQSKNGKSHWERLGNPNAYVVGDKICITYVEQKYKRPSDISGTIAKCIIDIKTIEYVH